MSGTETDTGVSREEFSAMMKRMDDLATAVSKLSDAGTKTEKREAKEEVESAEESLRRYAKAHGVSMEEAEEAIHAVRRTHQRNEIREILEEILEEKYPETSKDDTDTDTDDTTDDKDQRSTDSPPIGGAHWTDRRVIG